MSSRAKETVRELAELAGITLNGGNPWDIQIHDERFYKRLLQEGTLGFGEAYMDGWWDAERIDELVTRFIKANLQKEVRGNWRVLLPLAWQYITNTPRRVAFEIGEHHYDIGNDLYRAMLDDRMVYTCGYWKEADNLNDAQEAKLDLVCKKIGLKEGDRVLDIGCGWGSFMKFAAQKYGAHITGVTVSKEQVELGKEMTEGLPVEFKLQDYRDITGTYDHVVSLGMFEHVGVKNYKTFMSVVQRVLKDDGLFLLHTIGRNESGRATDPWIAKYIFPNSMVPSIKQIAAASEGRFVMEDWHNFGADYDKTLMAWLENFNEAWPKLKSKYNERFYRMWTYYLLISAAAFRSRKNQLWQVVLTKKGVPGGYTSIR